MLAPLKAAKRLFNRSQFHHRGKMLEAVLKIICRRNLRILSGLLPNKFSCLAADRDA